MFVARRQALAVALLLLAAAPATAATGSPRTKDILPLYNAERAANGLPQVQTINPQMELGCANHDHYQKLNGGGHGEDPSKPGYTPTGAMQDGAQGAEVLAQRTTWTAFGEPWSTAPIHLFFMFDPQVAQVGYADSEGFECMRMRGVDGPAPPRPPGVFYSWTSDYGPKAVPHAEHAVESPYTPQQVVGIPASRTTGPNILIWSADELGIPVSATMTGPSGPVDLRLVNTQSQNSIGDGKWFNGGGVLIPVAPLEQRTTYQVSVSWNNEGAAPQTFSFTTNRTNSFSLKLRGVLLPKRVVGWRVQVRSSAPHATVVLTGPHHRVVRPKLHHGRTAPLVLHTGHWTACAASGGGTSGYDAKSDCQQFDSAGSAPLPPQ